jgi:hypothetical protein
MVTGGIHQTEITIALPWMTKRTTVPDFMEPAAQPTALPPPLPPPPALYGGVTSWTEVLQDLIAAMGNGGNNGRVPSQTPAQNMPLPDAARAPRVPIPVDSVAPPGPLHAIADQQQEHGARLANPASTIGIKKMRQVRRRT